MVSRAGRAVGWGQGRWQEQAAPRVGELGRRAPKRKRWGIGEEAEQAVAWATGGLAALVKRKGGRESRMGRFRF